MDKTKQREEFEAEWFRETGEKLQYEPALSGYRYTQPNTAFNLWQTAQKAALASIEIELPSLKQSDTGERYVWSDGVFNFKHDAIEILKAKGLRVKS